ncbi:hypothetical protein A245_34268, partial [Pseudomonas syringae pv. actinidiae ICMP 19096]
AFGTSDTTEVTGFKAASQPFARTSEASSGPLAFRAEAWFSVVIKTCHQNECDCLRLRHCPSDSASRTG